ncbi:jg13086 [Pararge aegeria aegeria]|uniref:Jg13086 protein n=1 Tax=Pararge aegeria aegeria TaxID=348720 RepID=A0A8S4RNU5_9NEOP|nr:jg13086 [Pararge aegeria aegeria]
MPAYGTYSVDFNDRVPIRQGTIDAIEAGCRHIDTAFAYLTEDMVGEAIVDVIKRGIVKREDIYVTTKLSFELWNRKLVVPAMKKALKRLQLKYVDLVLIHTPVNVVNPTFVNQELVAYSQSKNITVAGYSSFGFLVKRVFNDLSVPPTFEDPKLVRMAKKHGVTVSQIVQRYLVDRSIIPIAASLNKIHIKLNVDIFDFTLNPEDIRTISEFDRNLKVFLVDYNGLFQIMCDGFKRLFQFRQSYNLQQYELRTNGSYTCNFR